MTTRHISSGSADRGGRRPAHGFTLVELLIVFAIIAILIAALTVVGRTVIDGNKRRITENTMRLATLAIEQFSNANPLKQLYDSRASRDAFNNQSFGSYVPYQLAYPEAPVASRFANPYDIARVVDGNAGAPGRAVDTLMKRLARDLVQRPGDSIPAAQSRVSITYGPARDTQAVAICDHTTVETDSKDGRQHNDIRAFYTYLRVLQPGVLDQLPRGVFRSLSRASGQDEFINTSSATPPNNDDRTPILAIVDAWGLPLDYFLNVRVEYAGGLAGQERFRVTDRSPVFRSRGISIEEYEEEQQSPLYHTDRAPSDPSKWLFSAAFPSPRANGIDADTIGPGGSYSAAGYAFRWRGSLSAPPGESAIRVNGWVRALGVGDISGKLAYVP